MSVGELVIATDSGLSQAGAEHHDMREREREREREMLDVLCVCVWGGGGREGARSGHSSVIIHISV